ncbi:uncharacterized protein PHACADRAFT_206656 [Phanerochaete carnosa HHB-10118-sp]|uniref:Post-SET domain-containing protein n=1 Tax=Phanerochaete carnosa (strain HHB-10118-sp) TaxID=650164 RepID=K5WFC6_PHACS|nr:uncharacterized protein PHACADRAFT_206656 [Phanerochaete carnosa HHB-10118-sp]EKM57779.1 hypothetical protein PHACADRAFT_206656 [Phanerochaete carnosa HHB-10118-sp]
MTATLASQPLSLSGGTPQPGDVVAHLQPQATVVQPEQPVKRRPGRPKGSGKKAIDLSTEPKIKRPVGRPRKDGLPAGSVGPKKPGRPRKRAPGSFATPTNLQSPGPPYPPPAFVDPAQWASISAPMASLSVRAPPSMNFPLDPSLDRDNWAELARHRTDAFLHALVTALSAPNPVSAAGSSVEDAFRAHLASLTPNPKNNNMPSIPALYSILKTFWLPSSPAYFALTASASTQRSTPSEYRFLYWDPQPLVFNGIACPICATPLINKGRISSGPIKIYDLGKPFFIIGCEYVCRSLVCLPGQQGEGRRFASTDTSILRALPTKLKDEFPARLIQGAGPTPDMGPGADVWSWRGMGVSTGLWDMVRVSLRSGLHKDVILGVVHAVIQGLPDEPWAMQPSQLGMEEKRDNAEEPEAADMSNTNEGQGPSNEDDEQEVDNTLNKGGPETEEFQEAWATQNNQPEASGSTMPEAGPSDPNMNNQVAVPPPPADYNPYAPPPNPYGIPFGYPPYGYYPPPPGHPPPPQPPSTLKRTFALVDSDGTEPTPRRVRHCVKCGSNECKGKGGRTFCVNPCQDCGKLDCKGRNSKRPDRTCADAWSPTESSSS